MISLDPNTCYRPAVCCLRMPFLTKRKRLVARHIITCRLLSVSLRDRAGRPVASRPAGRPGGGARRAHTVHTQTTGGRVNDAVSAHDWAGGWAGRLIHHHCTALHGVFRSDPSGRPGHAGKDIYGRRPAGIPIPIPIRTAPPHFNFVPDLSPRLCSLVSVSDRLP